MQLFSRHETIHTHTDVSNTTEQHERDVSDSPCHGDDDAWVPRECTNGEAARGARRPWDVGEYPTSGQSLGGLYGLHKAPSDGVRFWPCHEQA